LSAPHGRQVTGHPAGVLIFIVGMGKSAVEYNRRVPVDPMVQKGLSKFIWRSAIPRF
jgi:hypothetical protein